MSPGDWTAVAALIVSGWSAYKTITYGQVQNKLNKSHLEERDRLETERKKAKLMVTLESSNRLDVARLFIHNGGSVPARNVRLEPSGDQGVITSAEIVAKTPYEVLSEQTNFTLFAYMVPSSKAKFEFTVLWEDDFSKTNRQTFYVQKP